MDRGSLVVLELINTLRRLPDGDVEHLADVDALEAWVREHAGRLPQPEDAFAEEDLDAVRELREQVHGAVSRAMRGEGPPDEVLRTLTEAQREAPVYRELVSGPNGVTAIERRRGTYVQGLLAELADAATDLLIDPAVTTVRQCEAPGCVIYFLPAHPRRQWCSTACGNRVRVARHYRRHKQG